MLLVKIHYKTVMFNKLILLHVTAYKKKKNIFNFLKYLEPVRKILNENNYLFLFLCFELRKYTVRDDAFTDIAKRYANMTVSVIKLALNVNLPTP